MRSMPVLTALILGTTGCAQQRAPQGPLVLAAASTQEALSAAADDWAAAGHPRPVISFAATSALARQIESGAHADIFVSADEKWMNEVEKDGNIKASSRRNLTTNTLVMVAPQKGPKNVELDQASIEQALGQGRIAIADPDGVPAGLYGKAALENLSLWQSLKDRLARADNVRSALELVERGAAPLGIVYATDARASHKVHVVATFPDTSHPPIVYPVVLLKDSGQPAAGFYHFLLSSQVKAIFAAHGFGPPPN